MKCPKCQYLGFETSDRCKNCGYEFALMAPPDLGLRDDAAASDAPPLDLALHLEPSQSARPTHTAQYVSEHAPEPAAAAAPALPLFLSDDAGDEPLLRPSAPRPPVAVRKTPDLSRPLLPRGLPGDGTQRAGAFEFAEAVGPAPPSPGTRPVPVSTVPPSAAPGPTAASRVSSQDGGGAPSAWATLQPRLLAGLIDFGLLFVIDLVVVYFTLRLTDLTWRDLGTVPAVPLLVFLLGIKLTYLSTFTAAGGQTIGKMATGLRVVTDDDRDPDAWQAIGRASVEVASLLAFGAPFLLAFSDPGRRGLHDRLAQTRVVPVPGQ